MINVTDQAKALLVDLRQSADIPASEVGFRLSPASSGQFELFLDMRREGDQVVEHEGATLLIVAGELSPTLAGATMDCFATPEGPRLVVDRGAGEPS
jgi:Fe-S cluster assembly iron-binding protein IscA